MEERSRNDIVVRAVLGDQESDRKEMRHVGQLFVRNAKLAMVLARRELYRPLYLRRVIHRLSVPSHQ
jgi:hypothetical protein